jgi:hypothetical protein
MPMPAKLAFLHWYWHCQCSPRRGGNPATRVCILFLGCCLQRRWCIIIDLNALPRDSKVKELIGTKFCQCITRAWYRSVCYLTTMADCGYVGRCSILGEEVRTFIFTAMWVLPSASRDLSTGIRMTWAWSLPLQANVQINNYFGFTVIESQITNIKNVTV